MDEITSNKIQKIIKKDTLFKSCFHKDKNCKGKIIKAHSIQNNRVLNAISDNGHIISIKHQSFGSEYPLDYDEIGRKIASTFPGFCSNHDDKIFKPIEQHDYEYENIEQEFIYAYRALAREYCIKYQAKKMTENMINFKSKNNKLFNSLEKKDKYFINNSLKNIIKPFLIGTNNSFKLLENFRIRFNINLDNRKFFKIRTRRIVLSKEYPIAVSSVFYVQKDFEGNMINDLSQLNTYFKPTFLTIFPQNNKTYILISNIKNDFHYFNSFEKHIINKSDNEQKLIISNLICYFVENFYISPILYNSLNSEVKNKFADEFRETIFGDIIDLQTLNNFNIFIDTHYG